MNSKAMIFLVLGLMALPLAAFAAGTNELPSDYMNEPIPVYDLFDGIRDGADCDCIDLVFVIDDTGSMGGAISNVKAGLANILALAGNQSCGDLQGGVVSFADDVEVDQALTFTLSDVTNALNALNAAGGAGWPEASDEAMHEISTAASCLAVGDFLTSAWRDSCCKVAILVTDAHPGGCDDIFTVGTDDVSAANAANALAALGVQVGSLYVLSEGFADPTTQAIMLNYASTTGGVYGEVPADGTGTAAAIEQVILNCIDGSTETELCCTPDGNCTVVLEGQCDAIGGTVVTSCDDCEATAAESTNWSTVKGLY
jgi:hypothetical protein